jgi:hypothetical protein
MPIIDLTPIQNLAAGLGGLALATPQQTVGYVPQSADLPTPPAFLFDIEDENSLDLDSDLSNHWIENNTSISDQWALRPEMVTVHGNIAEVTDIPPVLPAEIKLAREVLGGIGLFNPQISQTAQLAIDTAVQTYQAINNVANSAVSAWGSLINGSRIQTRQQQVWQMFYGYWKSRTLWTIQTPWGILTDMAPLKIRAVQGGETRTISEFIVTFQKMRFASTQSTLISDLAGRAAQQGAAALEQGTSTPNVDKDLGSFLSNVAP